MTTLSVHGELCTQVAPTSPQGPMGQVSTMLGASHWSSTMCQRWNCCTSAFDTLRHARTRGQRLITLVYMHELVVVVCIRTIAGGAEPCCGIWTWSHSTQATNLCTIDSSSVCFEMNAKAMRMEVCFRARWYRSTPKSRSTAECAWEGGDQTSI